MKNPLNSSQKLRFALVGAINTGLDFSIFMTISLQGVSPIWANYAATTVALTFSFFVNRKFTFRATGKHRSREIALFLLFTLIGLWALQPLVIGLCKWLFGDLHPTWAFLIVSKLLATTTSLTWNYTTYSRYVFTGRNLDKEPS